MLDADRIAQAAILILTPLAVCLVAEGLRWGFVVGLASQPFWIHATARAKQGGMFVISLFYLAIWIRGIVVHFPGFLS